MRLFIYLQKEGDCFASKEEIKMSTENIEPGQLCDTEVLNSFTPLP